MTRLDLLVSEIREKADKKRSERAKSFSKTGIGEYGEGDVFIGISTPVLRVIARKYFDLKLNDLEKLLGSRIHEERSLALMILAQKYKRGKEESAKSEIYDFYIKNRKGVNNWGLVDISAWHIAGNFLIDHSKDRSVLYEFARSSDLWERRISIVATYAFIRKNQFDDTLKICEILMRDSHDLIHKACGWMLREVGKKDQKILEEFLRKNYDKMPRTTLRYAIEKFPEKKRKLCLKGKFD